MMKTILLLLFLLYGGAANAAIAVVASTSAGSSDGANVTTAAITTTGANLLIVAVSDYWAYGIGDLTLTDSNSNTWVARSSFSQNSNAEITLFYATGTPTVGASHTFTLTGTGAQPSIAVLALSGAHATAPFDAENANGVTIGGSTNTGSVSPAGANEIMISAISVQEDGALSIDSGFTLVEQVTHSGGVNFGLGLAYKIQTSAGAEDPTWTFEHGDRDGEASLTAFTAAAGALAPRHKAVVF